MNALRIFIPLGLGLIAGLVNFVVVRGLTAPIEVVGVNDDLRAGTVFTKPDVLVKVQIRTENKDILRSAIPWSERGTLMDRKLNRPLAKGELVLFADVRTDTAEDVQALLQGDEISYTFAVRNSRVAPGLQLGVEVGILIETPSPDGGRERGIAKVIGPFRLVGMSERPDPARAASGVDEYRKVSVAVKPSAKKELEGFVSDLETAAAATDGGGATERRNRILAVEYYKQSRK